jgi:DNA-binding CsgD family transcriptional regulator
VAFGLRIGGLARGSEDSLETRCEPEPAVEPNPHSLIIDQQSGDPFGNTAVKLDRHMWTCGVHAEIMAVGHPLRVTEVSDFPGVEDWNARDCWDSLADGAMMPSLLLEREHELAAISEGLGGARAGDGAALLVEGPAGIGKTALLEHARSRAADLGMRVLAARGGELEAEFPFGMVRQLFEPVIRELSPRARREVLGGAAKLAAPVVAGAHATPTAGEDRSSAVSHGLYWLTANLAERAPLLFAVDDLHWADAPSVRFLLFLTRRLAGLPAGLVMCTRPGEPSPEPTLLGQLTAEPTVRVLRPAGLSESAATSFIGDRLGAEPHERFVRACVTATGGTPFLLGELVGALATDGVGPTAEAAAGVSRVGPATVAHATLLRIARLPAAAASVARAVAVLGAAAETERVARLAGLEPGVALEAADALAAIRILRSGAPLRFVHPILHAAVYDDLPAGERAGAHARAASLLAAAGADPDAVAAHLLLSARAGDREVIEQLRLAASGALARGAPENATAYLVRALAEGVGRETRAELLCELAAATRLTNPQAAIEQLQEAQSIAADPVLRARAGADLAYLFALIGDWGQSVATVDAALKVLGDRDRELAVLLERLACGQAAYDPRLVKRFDQGRMVLRAAIDDGVATARAPALLLAAIAAARGEKSADVLPLVERGLDGGSQFAEESAVALIPQAFAALVIIEELDRAADLAEDLLTGARTRGSVHAFLVAMAHRAWIQTRRGDLLGAEADLRMTVELAQEHRSVFALASTVWYGADALLERPSLTDVAQLAQAIELPPDLAATFTGAFVLETRGRLRCAQGDAAGGVGDLRAAWQIAEALRFFNPNVSNLRSDLALALACDQPDEAWRVANALLDDARRVGFPRAVGLSLRTLGVLEGGQQGSARLREAVGVLEGSPARLELARALVELGAALRRGNQRVEARRVLGNGLELALRCGATRLGERARSELQASGGRPRREPRTGVDALTPSELRVARMAADGMSNPQIGQSLFVSRNTIETHLRHIYEKLGIHSRQDLPGRLKHRTGAGVAD